MAREKHVLLESRISDGLMVVREDDYTKELAGTYVVRGTLYGLSKEDFNGTGNLSTHITEEIRELPSRGARFANGISTLAKYMPFLKSDSEMLRNAIISEQFSQAELLDLDVYTVRVSPRAKPGREKEYFSIAYLVPKGSSFDVSEGSIKVDGETELVKLPSRNNQVMIINEPAHLDLDYSGAVKISRKALRLTPQTERRAVVRRPDATQGPLLHLDNADFLLGKGRSSYR